MRTLHNSLIAVSGAGLLLIGACSQDIATQQDRAGRSGAPPASSTLTMESTSLQASRAALVGRTGAALGGLCVRSGESGACRTPTRVAGYVGAVMLAASEPDARGLGPARLLGRSVHLGIDRDGIVEVAPFDLAAPTTIPGEDALGGFEGVRHDILGLGLAQLDVQVAVGGVFWNLRFNFVSQPLTLEPEYLTCLDEHVRERYAASSKIDPMGPDLYRGDVLVCKKSSSEETCTWSDYQWYDTASRSFTSERPPSPWSFRDLLQPPTCDSETQPDGSVRSNADANGHKLWAELMTPFELSAEYRCGGARYSHNDGGETTAGSAIDSRIDFEMSNFVFFPGLVDPDTASDETIVQSLTLASLFEVSLSHNDWLPRTSLQADVDVIVDATDSDPCEHSHEDPMGDDGEGGPLWVDPATFPDGGVDSTPLESVYAPPRSCMLAETPSESCTHTACEGPGWTPLNPTWSQGHIDGVACEVSCLVETCGSDSRELICAPDCE